ncbi:MAG: 2-amino-4-hydroxy-6-hydroxymethyldihydropteridine diphosphokinase [Pseudoxanthomonas sp.]
MSTDSHRYILLLGSATSPVAEAGDAKREQQLRRARDLLKQRGKVLARSGVVHADSVVPGDGDRYVNQALLYASSLSRDAFTTALKTLEQRLGRSDERDGACAIDIDLVGECDAQGQTLWENAAKLEHPLFRDLVARVARR